MIIAAKADVKGGDETGYQATTMEIQKALRPCRKRKATTRSKTLSFEMIHQPQRVADLADFVQAQRRGVVHASLGQCDQTVMHEDRIDRERFERVDPGLTFCEGTDHVRVLI